MPGAVLLPEEVGPADAARVLSFLNAASSASELADTIGLSEGGEVGRRVAAAILARRAEAGPLPSLDAVLAVTGVTLQRFTEIVTALSGARPVPAGGTLRLVPTTETPWLGQGVGIVGQVLDSAGRGVPNATVTCVTSSGLLSATAGTERQSGAAVSLTTEPGGVVRFHLGPPLAPPLDPAPAAALQAELAQLPPAARTPDAARDALVALAARYRAEGAAFLRTAVDRLFDSFPAEEQSALAPWPVMPVTLIAMAGGQAGRAEYVTVLTLRTRNWLGGWLGALRAAVAGDTRLGEALKNLDSSAEAGADLSQALIRATDAFAGLERGAVGARLRDAAAGAAVNRYVERVAPKLEADAIINTVRTAGASKAAISAGGFAVFEAIRATQDVQDTIITPRGPGGFEGRLDLLDSRLGTLEASALDRRALDALRAELERASDTRLGGVEAGLAGVSQRLGAVEAKAVDRAALDGLRDDILSRTDERLGRLQGRLDELETRRLDRAELDAVEGRVTQGFDSRMADRLAALEARLGALVADAKAELGGEIARTEREMAARIDQKADARTVSGLERSVLDLRQSNATLTDRLNVIRPIR